MRGYEFIKEELIRRHETIDNIEYLEKYIKFLLNYELIDSMYSEKHHILPRSTFPEFKDESWNIIELNYEDHRKVHLWIFKAINIRSYQKPLNFMMKEYKNSKEISKAAKKGWENLKADEEKYSEFCKKKSTYMKGLSSEEQRRRANIFWKNISDERYLKFCNNVKLYWTSEKKLKKSNDMKNFYLDENEVEKKRIETKERWDSMDEEVRVKFREKMDLINKNVDKRKDAGNKIKEKWLDPEYLEKMKNRNKKIGLKIKVIKGDNIEIFENMEDMVRKYKFSTHLIRKYRDTNIAILERHLNRENIMLLGHKIETIKINI